ncbi:MAG: F0F1 ATP synthase subunit B [Bacilli bacterium]|jgi:F-type H+-transporting ATPase subunit b|nr:F0F1 ATP synthase subunit B [Bacilli bacterium]
MEINLFPNILKMLSVWLATAVLFFFFYKFFWKSVQDFFAKRQEYMANQIDMATQANKQATEYESKTNETMKKARIDAKNIVDRSKNEAIRLKEEILAKANDEAKEKITSAQIEIDREKEQAMKEIENEIIDVALLAAQEVIKENLDADKSKVIVDDFIKELKA